MRCCITTRVGHALTGIPPPPPPQGASSTDAALQESHSIRSGGSISQPSNGLSCQEWRVWAMRCCITTRVGHALTGIPPPPPPQGASSTDAALQESHSIRSGGSISQPSNGLSCQEWRVWAMRCCITTRVGHASTEIPPPPPQRFISYGLLGLGVLFSARPHGLHARPGHQGGGGGLAAQGKCV